ncbi:hypothetical protein KUTeg_019145 [Tegillarca granosa]|uniref:Fucosyltransferase n=1 Tax=Tegillarca granosa TaxID=220873 RepID=A0ABQ9EBP0_TEGGR|nr:hypothetical protein KUTeg_019145 [Tegillarca granosa]
MKRKILNFLLVLTGFCVLYVIISYRIDKTNVYPVRRMTHSTTIAYNVDLENITRKDLVDKLPLQKRTPVILFYNRPDWISFDNVANLDACPYKCDFTDDKNKLDDSEAVFFVSSEHPRVPKQGKKKEQIWIFFNLESPITYPNGFKQWENLINWTMTYRLDSDIWTSDHEIVLNENSGYNPNNKSKPVSWLVSHCNVQSRRDEFTKILKKHIKVDNFGNCGTMKVNCKGYANNDCWRGFLKRYFFYLSLENSFCRDYITEKAFNPLNNSIVPVVRGGAFYNKYLPLQSYINTANFETIKSLSDYLTNLIENEALFRNYFTWRKHYNAILYSRIARSFCELCRRLHFKDKYKRYYESLYDWWVTGAHCNNTIEDLH